MVLTGNFVGFETTGLEERGGTMNYVLNRRGTYRGNAWTRADMERLIRQSRNAVQSTVSNQTHYLVASRTDTRKAAAAERHGVTVITYDMFMTMMQNAIAMIPDRDDGRTRTGPLRRIDFEFPPRAEGRMGDLSVPSVELMAARGNIRRPNLSEPLNINPCSEVHLPKDHRVTSKNRPVKTVAHGGPIRRKLDL